MQIKKYSEISDQVYKTYTGIMLYNRSKNKAYFLNGRLHREDGPAIEGFDGYKEWWIDGKLHRTDGPAVEHVNGNKSWYFNNQRIDIKSQEEFESWLVMQAFK